MSSLIFFADESQVLVATDTLATEPDGRPLKFATKAYVVPHLRLIMAGIGVLGFLSRWFVYMNDSVVVRGIDSLDYHAPRALASLWNGYKEELSIPDNITSTVYHLGFSESTELIHLFAYRSVDNFKSERLEPYGLRIKPECHVPADYKLPADIIKMMDEQRRVQASKPKNERLFIGGEIEIHYLSDAGFTIYTLHQFDDYDRDETAIYDRFRETEK